jgi:D-alanine-D-alanine ligase
MHGGDEYSVAILAGGLSHERDISLRSGRRVANALRGQGYQVREYDTDDSLLGKLRDAPPSCVFPVLHGESGEDGAIREVLEMTGLPYVGSAPAACRAAFDKAVAKRTLAHQGHATPESVCLPHATFRELGAREVMAALADAIGFPMMVKPTRGGSALGASLVSDLEELPSAMIHAFSYGDVALIERFIKGTEIAVSVIDHHDEPTALPAVAIFPDSPVYDYTARYTAGTTEFLVPAALSVDVGAACAALAVQAHLSLGLRDISRSDLIVDSDGVPWFLEVNVAPGLTETSLLPLAVSAADLSLGDVLGELVVGAIRRCDR